MKKIILIVSLVAATVLLSNCGGSNACYNCASNSCCGSNGWSGSWY